VGGTPFKGEGREGVGGACRSRCRRSPPAPSEFEISYHHLIRAQPTHIAVVAAKDSPDHVQIARPRKLHHIRPDIVRRAVSPAGGARANA
jgi:hypothetical protein